MLFPVYITRQRNLAFYVTGLTFTCKHFKFGLNTTGLSQSHFTNLSACSSLEPWFNEVTRDRPNLFVKLRVRYIENLDITNLRGNDENVRYIEVIVNY